MKIDNLENVLKEVYELISSITPFGLNMFESDFDAAFDEISAVKSDDVVEVVRCNDCIHYEFGVCLKIYDDGQASKQSWQSRKPDDFCSYGKR